MLDCFIYSKAVAANWFDDYGYLTAVPEIFQKIGPLFLPEKLVRCIASLLDAIAESQNRQKFYIFLVLAGVFFAGYSAWDEQYQLASAKSPEAVQAQIAQTVEAQVREQVVPLNTKLGTDDVEIANLQARYGDLSRQVAPLLKGYAASINAVTASDELKKQALELASTLIGRATAIKTLAYQYPARREWPPGSLEPQRERQQMLVAQRQAQIDAAQLLSDYKTTYADQVTAYRLRFIQQGQKDWGNELNYQNPTTMNEIQDIGVTLSKHANRLK